MPFLSGKMHLAFSSACLFQSDLLYICHELCLKWHREGKPKTRNGSHLLRKFLVRQLVKKILIYQSSLQALVEHLRSKCLEEHVDKNVQLVKGYSILNQASKEWASDPEPCSSGR